MKCQLPFPAGDGITDFYAAITEKIKEMMAPCNFTKNEGNCLNLILSNFSKNEGNCLNLILSKIKTLQGNVLF